jgi:hypothetical protein
MRFWKAAKYQSGGDMEMKILVLMMMAMILAGIIWQRYPQRVDIELAADSGLMPVDVGARLLS